MPELRLINIPELFGKRFLIPKYQRGYRWDKRQIQDLLSDIISFYDNSSGDDFYCLQPIIVAPNGDSFAVIDGQQRLTTIFIILSYLRDARDLIFSDTSMFEIEYETRHNSQTFLQNIRNTSEIDYRNCDYYFMSQAYLYIKSWFEDKRINKGDFLNALLKNTQNVTLIWYNVDANPEEASKQFTRINMWKIPLTNSELVKGTLFSSKNWRGNERDKLNTTSLEWDLFEKALQNPKFWFFINKSKKRSNTFTHMDLIFEILADMHYEIAGIDVSKDKDAYYSFYVINELLEKNIMTHIDLWKRVKTIFRIFEEWYHDNDYYHLVGFLIHKEAQIIDLVEQFSRLRKDDFKQYLIDKIRSLFNNRIKNQEDLLDLSYTEDRDRDILFTVVLLHNVRLCLKGWCKLVSA